MKTAVVLFNLGGPDSPEAVRPFLFNLFSDPAIIPLPQPFRRLLALLISWRRAPIAKYIYAEMGGKSPILVETLRQAEALQRRLGADFRVFVSMRYWHPLSRETAECVKAWQPDRVILLPLYPQFSTTTAGSSIADWRRAAKQSRFDAPTRAICCYPAHPLFIAAHTASLLRVLDAARNRTGREPRILFSAHGLPERVIADGDPYQWQVEQTVAAIVAQLASPELDYRICYQSRVGPMKWIGPATDAEIIEASSAGIPLVVAPIAFVSEHSETLVELDIEYRRLAEAHGNPHYFRVPALGTDEWFIDALANIVGAAMEDADCERLAVCPADGGRFCPSRWEQCPVHEER